MGIFKEKPAVKLPVELTTQINWLYISDRNMLEGIQNLAVKSLKSTI